MIGVLIETKNLKLRPLKLSDLDDFYEYASNEKVGNNSTWKPHSSKEESLNILTSFVKDKEYLAIIDKKDKKLIGIIGFHEDPFRALGSDKLREIGYGLNYNYWDRGYMTEAASAAVDYIFSNTSIECLTAYTADFNKRSQRVIEKLGFFKEGILNKSWINYKGEVHSRYCYFLNKNSF